MIEGKKIVGGRPEPGARVRPADRLLGHDRHAGLHQHAQPPVRDHPARHHRRRAASCSPAIPSSSPPTGPTRPTAPWSRASGPRAASDPRHGPADWDIGRSPYDPEDCYIAELIACLSQITQGITWAPTPRSAPTLPQHTDAMIQGLMDSGQRVLFDYSGGINRSAQFPDQPFEYPGAIGETSLRLGRAREKYFSSKDQLVTLGFGGRAHAGRSIPRPGPTRTTRAGSSPASSAPSSTTTTSAGSRSCSTPRRIRGTAPTVRRHAGALRPLAGQPARSAADRAWTTSPRRPGRSGPTAAATSRSRCSSRCRCATACRRSSWRSTTASCRA